MSSLAGKVAVITGGGSGIGAATARRFVAEGAHVLIVGRREHVLVDTVKDIGGEISYAVADVSTPEGCGYYVEHAVARYGRIDVLIANAGIDGVFKPITDTDVAEFDEVMAINVRGVWLSVKHVLPAMIAGGGGSIVLMSSVAGLVGFAGMSAYIASKHAVLGLTRCLALETAAHRIRVNAICPGFTDNEMWNALLEKSAPVLGTDPSALRAMLAERVPVKRPGTSEEVAALATWLAGDESSYLTGTHQVVDGGLTAGVI
jgi:NAD(P)-dependent dehydrogenase (short-subunit alcohol dehydrogenase family)